MTVKHAANWLGALLLATVLVAPAALRAQQQPADSQPQSGDAQPQAGDASQPGDAPQAGDAPQTADAPQLSKEELQQILAPIALYPDELLTNVLMAATYPLEVVQAARWQKANAKLKGDALTKALEGESWDPSVKSLVPFPDVLQNMSEKLEWTQKVGDAFLGQQAEVMDQIQFLRARADDAGNLKTNKYQKVEKQGQAIVIEPAQPETVYVPVYEPAVYGTWWAPAYPPYYLPPPVGAVLVGGIFWGAGYAITNSLWGWNRWDWGRHNVYINTNRYNNINVGRRPINSNTWRHNPAHRGSVPYKGAARERYGSGRPAGDARGTRPGDRGGPGAGANRGGPGAGTAARPGDRSKGGASKAGSSKAGATKSGASKSGASKSGGKSQAKGSNRSGSSKSGSRSAGSRSKSGASSKGRSSPPRASSRSGRPPSGARSGGRSAPRAGGAPRGGNRGGARGGNRGGNRGGRR